MVRPLFFVKFTKMSLFYRSTNTLAMYNDSMTDEIFSRLTWRNLQSQ